MKKDLWYAVNTDGKGNVFTSLPVRNNAFGVWEGRMESCFSGVADAFVADGFLMPRITYNDVPVKLTLSVDL